MNKKYNLELNESELLVLDSLLSWINESEVLSDFFEDQAEQVVLWHLEWLCEKNNPVGFSKNYSELLQEARDELKHSES